MKRRILCLFVVALTLFFLMASLTSAAPGAPGAPTLRWVTTGATTAELRADGLTDGGTAGNGAISWDIYFRFPASVNPPYPVVSISAGPSWTGMSPCSFGTNVSLNQPSDPGATGDRGVLINGFCTTGVPGNPVTGNDVLVAVVTLASCPAGTVEFEMDLDSGDDVFGVSVVDFADRNNDAFYLSDADMTDGTPMCLVTAVTLANFAAVAQPDHVLVTWETASELDNAGFNLYRDTSPAGPGVRVNSTLIASQAPGGTGGFSYSWQDFDAPYSQSLYYWLEDVDFSGSTSREGPVSVELAEWTAVELDRFDAQTTEASWPPALLGLAALGAPAGVILTLRHLRRGRQAVH